ncbi:MAG: hypothetical protein JWM09_260 [Francisellaceae bacterium]|nr:hypothetical protein [Francisellaceae bacterium]
MCGRFSLTVSAQALIEHFKLTKGLYMSPRYNIAPFQPIPIIRTWGEIDFVHWGLKAAWMKNDLSQKGFINARAETVAIKPAFKSAFLKKRCLVLSDGYYEWKQMGKTKQPFYIRLKNKEVFAFAGIWESSNKKDAKEESCAILTIDAKGPAHEVHPRMPLILKSEQYETWLDLKSPLKAMTALLQPNYVDDFEIFPISLNINNPKFDGPSCILPLLR